MEDLVSVIVPVYNAEKYLKDCIESAAEQSYPKIEIILVDDGSSDRSGDICDFYARRDPRIYVIHKENGGNTSARRVGLSHAKGEFVTFVDADDLIQKNMVRHLMAEIKRTGADAVISNLIERYSYGDIELKNMFSPGVYEKTPEFINNIIQFKDANRSGIITSLHGKLYRYNFIRRAFENIGNELQYGEDTVLNYWCAFHAKRISFIDENYYIYNRREGRITTERDPRFLLKVTEFYLYAKKIIEQETEKERLLKQLDKQMVNLIVKGINWKIGLSESNLIRRFYLDEHQLEESNRVILYGAGGVGKDFYKQLSNSSKLKVIAWVDYNFEKYKAEHLPVQPVETINNLKYDYILVAVLRTDLFENMKEFLMRMSVPDNKIVWIEPQKLF